MDELRHALKNCQLCAYIDLDVELVLSISAQRKPPQEHLDALARLASGLLLPDPEPSSDPPGPGSEVTTYLTKDRSYFLLRSPTDPSEVICCQCGAQVDPEAVAAGINLTLKWIEVAA